MTFEEAAREHLTAVADGQVADLAALLERYCERGFYACRDRVVAKLRAQSGEGISVRHRWLERVVAEVEAVRPMEQARITFDRPHEADDPEIDSLWEDTSESIGRHWRVAEVGQETVALTCGTEVRCETLAWFHQSFRPIVTLPSVDL